MSDEGGHGWMRTRVGDLEVRFRVGRGDDGCLQVTSLHLDAEEITSDTLRALRPARLLAAWVANSMGGGDGEPLGRPDGTDAFYARFAGAYRSAVAESSRPAAVIAAENDAPVESVRRWIKEARRRGHLPPARKGRAG